VAQLDVPAVQPQVLAEVLSPSFSQVPTAEEVAGYLLSLASYVSSSGSPEVRVYVSADLYAALRPVLERFFEALPARGREYPCVVVYTRGGDAVVEVYRSPGEVVAGARVPKQRLVDALLAMAGAREYELRPRKRRRAQERETGTT